MNQHTNLSCSVTSKNIGIFNIGYVEDTCFELIFMKNFQPLVSSTEMIVKGRSYRFVRHWLGQGLLTSSGIFINYNLYLSLMKNNE